MGSTVHPLCRFFNQGWTQINSDEESRQPEPPGCEISPTLETLTDEVGNAVN